MLRSRANTLVSVRRVTERNAGRLTAGVDGEVVLTPEAKARLAERVHQNTEPFKALPVRRVYIPKPGSRKRRPLGIPVIADRCHQARVVNALEPEWEARFEPRSYGFRPGRGCHDAIQAVYEVVKGRRPKRLWALDADLAQAFDRIAHDHILAMLGTFPARGMVAQWLKAGVVEQGRLHRTEDGVPQGGVVSPLLLNVALHGMEEVAGARYTDREVRRSDRCRAARQLIRYADDFVVLCHSRQEALEVKARLAGWLAPRGLAFNEDKTRVVCLDEGFDFLGFNVRRYDGKPLIKPSKAAVRRIRKRLRDGDALPAREQRSRGDQKAQPDHSGLGRLLPDAGLQRRVQPAGSAPVAAHLQVGQVQPPEQAEDLGRCPVLRQVQQVQAGPLGVRRPQQRRLPPQVLLDPNRPAPARQTRGVTRRPRAGQLLGLATAQRSAPADQQDHPASSPTPRTVAARSAEASLFTVEDRPQNPREWEKWLAHPHRRSSQPRRSQATPEEAAPRLLHTDCRKRLGPELLHAYEPSGLA